MPMSGEDPAQPGLTDHEVVDEQHQHVGKVTDVILDDHDFTPLWATVKTGVLRGEHLAPLEGAYLSDDGRLVLPYSKDLVLHAPKAPRDHVLTPDLTQDVQQHYAMG